MDGKPKLKWALTKTVPPGSKAAIVAGDRSGRNGRNPILDLTALRLFVRPYCYCIV